MDSIINFQNYIQNWRFATIVVIVIGGRGACDNKTLKKLLTADGESEFDQDILVLGNNFKT
jgi:hypothetical protein